MAEVRDEWVEAVRNVEISDYMEPTALTEDEARDVLDAVTPLIQAAALHDAAEALFRDGDRLMDGYHTLHDLADRIERES